MSNIVFVCVGQYMLVAAVYDYGRNFPVAKKLDQEIIGIRRRPLWSVALGLTSIFAGIGSFAFHAGHGSGITGALDIASIYFLVWACFCAILYNTLSVYKLSTGGAPASAHFSSTKDDHMHLLILVLWLMGTPVLWYWEHTLWYGSWTIMKIVLVVGMIVISSVGVTGAYICKCRLDVPTNEFPFLLAAAICIVGAVIVWAPFEIFGDCDVFYVDGDSLFQLHALWHGLVALAVLFFYLYFRSFGNPKVTSGVAALSDFVLFRDAVVERGESNVATRGSGELHAHGPARGDVELALRDNGSGVESEGQLRK
eukprot:g5066.t1